MRRSPKAQRRRALRRRIRDGAILIFLRTALRVARHVPLQWASRAGDAVGRIVFALAGHRRRRTLRHLRIAFGESLAPTRRRAIAGTSFRTLLACAAEWLVMSSRGQDAAVGAIEWVEGWEHVEAEIERGRGLVLVTAHFGLFELLPVYFVSRGLEGKVVARRASNEGVDALITENRARMGVICVPQQRARELLRVLRRGGTVGALPDQDIDKLPGVFVPFFGRPAYTVTGPAVLSVTTGAPLLPVFSYRLGPGRHGVVIHPAVADPGGEDREARVEAITAAYTLVFEQVIRATPGHWAWVHERWSTTPEKLARRRARRADKTARATRRRLAGDSV